MGLTATSVAPVSLREGFFSKTGYIASDRRALLKPSKLRDLTFLNCNWQIQLAHMPIITMEW